ncbi:MAG: glycosyltransferase family 9 protein [Chlorobiota bacterium]|nr:MAG: glycosyltransferase family 9 protein [Chlorobiota bacterium]
MLTAKSPVNRILLIKFRGIGDVILSTVVLKNLKARYPDAAIDFLTEKPSAPLLRDTGLINDVIVFDGNRGTELFRKIMLIRRRKYDLVIDMYSNPKSAQLTFASGARFRAGFPYRGRKYAYNLFGPPERGVHHAGDLHLRFLESIGVPVVSRETITAVPAPEKLWAEEYFSALDHQGPFVALVPGGGWASKRCDPEKFAEIGNEICERFKVKSLVLWGKGDLQEAEKIVELMGGNAILAPESTFLQMGALALNCKLAVANDSGPMHFISSLGVPVLALHGPTDPALQGPFGAKHETVRLDELDCICCNLLECNRSHECFRDLPLERVMKKIESLISKNRITFSV